MERRLCPGLVRPPTAAVIDCSPNSSVRGYMYSGEGMRIKIREGKWHIGQGLGEKKHKLQLSSSRGFV